MAKITLRSWTNCDELMGKMAALQSQIDAAKAEYQPQIDELERKLRECCDPLEAELSEYREAVEKFAKARADEFDGKRSKKLINGTIKLTASTRVDIEDADSCLEKLRKLGKNFAHCIKATFKLDRLAIGKLPVDIINEIGGKLVTTDSVTIKLLSQAEPAKAKKAKK